MSVVKALFLRELQTRFGSKKLGYFWAIAEPVLIVFIFTLIKNILHPRAFAGISYPVFLASGFIGYYMFKNITLRAMNSFDANKALFIYKQVKPFDTIIARALVEILIAAIIIVIFLFVGWYLGVDLRCKNILGVIVAYLWLALFGISLGIFLAVVGFFYPNLKKIVNLIFMPLFFISAIFYTLDSLPPPLQKILIFNPLVHFMEMIHGNFFYSLDTHNVNYLYMAFWTLVPLYLGLWIYKKAEKKIIMS